METAYPKGFTHYLRSEGIKTLYPHQKEAMGYLGEGKSVLLATPTSSGKTAVAYYGMLRAAEAGVRSLYVVPLRALAVEKHSEMQVFRDIGLKTGISTGDFDTVQKELREYDVLVCTPEKADSIMRNSPGVLEGTGFFVLDEVHTIGEENRGSTLEMVAARIRYGIPGSQVLAMSATVANAGEVAEWLGAVPVVSDFRPVRLEKFLLLRGKAMDSRGEVHEAPDLGGLVAESLKDGGQTIVFTGSRKGAEKLAADLSEKVEGRLSGEEKEALESAAGEGSAEGKLAECIRRGVAFHHAGMLPEHRRLVETLFKERKLKVITATTTLAAGLNLPARTVVVRDIYRFTGKGSQMIPNMEVQQMLGRAGRAKYDTVGYGYVCSSEIKAEEAYSKYIAGPVEGIRSALGGRRMRMHVLGLVASGTATDTEGMQRFFANTLAHTQGVKLEEGTEEALEFLERSGMIRNTGGGYRATYFGKTVSELYIDPLTGYMMKKGMALEGYTGVLAVLSASPDMPPVSTGRFEPRLLAEEEKVLEIIGGARRADPEGVKPPRDAFKMAMVLTDWIEEVPEKTIEERYGIYPGDLRSTVETAEWLTHAFYQVSRALERSGREELLTLHLRVKDGIKEDLLEIASIKGVGRVRARRLARAGFTTAESIAEADDEDMERIAEALESEKLAAEIRENAREMRG